MYLYTDTSCISMFFCTTACCTPRAPTALVAESIRGTDSVNLTWELPTTDSCVTSLEVIAFSDKWDNGFSFPPTHEAVTGQIIDLYCNTLFSVIVKAVSYYHVSAQSESLEIVVGGK